MLIAPTLWTALHVLANLDSKVMVLNALLSQLRMNVKMETIPVTLLAVHALIPNTATNANAMLVTGIPTQQILDAHAMDVAVLFN